MSYCAYNDIVWLAHKALPMAPSGEPSLPFYGLTRASYNVCMAAFGQADIHVRNPFNSDLAGVADLGD